MERLYWAWVCGIAGLVFGSWFDYLIDRERTLTRRVADLEDNSHVHRIEAEEKERADG